MKSFFIAISIVVVILVIVMFIYPIIKSNKVIGTIVRIDERENDWGLKVDFWEMPLGSRKMRIANLSPEFQNENQRVKLTYEKVDVIGTSDWDIVVNVINIEKLRN